MDLYISAWKQILVGHPEISQRFDTQLLGEEMVVLFNPREWIDVSGFGLPGLDGVRVTDNKVYFAGDPHLLRDYSTDVEYMQGQNPSRYAPREGIHPDGNGNMKTTNSFRRYQAVKVRSPGGEPRTLRIGFDSPSI